MRPNKPTADERELLQQLDQLQARAQMPEIEPPALIDQAVRNMARRELHGHSPPLAGKLRWIAGLSTASIALIALGISLVQSPYEPGPADESFKSKKTEISSMREESRSATPAAPPAPVSGARLKQDQQLPKESLEKQSVLADSPYNQAELAEEMESADIDSAQAGEDPALAWLDLIQQLHEQGLRAEALEQLQAWQQQYPDQPLPNWAAELLAPKH